MAEHVPITDRELERLADELGTHDAIAIIDDLRESRRLLRAVEWQPEYGRDDPVCAECGSLQRAAEDDGHCACDIGRYLAACDGKESR